MTNLLANAALGAAYKKYRESKNPSYLFDGLKAARHAGVPMPDWILDDILPALDKMSEDGALTLDAALGLARRRGQKSRETARTQRERDTWIIGRLKIARAWSLNWRRILSSSGSSTNTQIWSR